MKEGWEIKSLEEVCTFLNGLWTGKKPPYQTVGVIRNTNFTKDGKLDDSEIVYLDVEQSQFAKRKLHFGDIILEKSGGGPKQPVGRVVLFDKVDGDFSFSNFTSAIRIAKNQEINHSYLHQFLIFMYVSGVTESMQSHSTGIRNLKFEDYKSIQIPLPPLPEQQRIVSIIDEAFEAIEKAIENTQKNLQNTRDLFESYLDSLFENGGEGWEMKKLIDICNSKSDIVGGPFGSNLKVEDYIDSGVPILRLQNIGKGYFINKGIKYISETKSEELKYHSFKSGDIALAKLGIPIGKTCIIPQDFQTGIVVADVVRIRPNFRIVRVEYLNYFLNSKYSVSQLTKNITGSTRPRVNIVDVREIDIPLPSITQQEIIVADIAKIELQTQTIESKYQQKLRDLEELKKSVLNKAFAGEL